MKYIQHANNAIEFNVAREIPDYNYYCNYSYCIQKYDDECLPIPIQLMSFESDIVDNWKIRTFDVYGLKRIRRNIYPIIIDEFFEYDPVCSDYTRNFDFNLPNYTRGFLDGYSKDLVPFVDSPDARKELVFKVATKSQQLLGWKYDNDNKMIITDNYKMGVIEGLRYKAWHVISQTPSVFKDLFQKKIAFDKTPSFESFLSNCDKDAVCACISDLMINQTTNNQINVFVACITKALQEKKYICSDINKVQYHQAFALKFGKSGRPHKFNERINEINEASNHWRKVTFFKERLP